MNVKDVRMRFNKGCRIYALGAGIIIVTGIETVWNKKIDVWRSVDCGRTWVDAGVSTKDKIEKIIEETNLDGLNDSDTVSALMNLVYNKLRM